MSASKPIVVLGATGNQGGSVVDTFLQDPSWRVRGLTRNPSSPKSVALKARGVEVVQANMDEPATLPVAFEGAAVIFATSNFWDLYANPANMNRPKPGQQLNAWAKEQETIQLFNVIDAAARVPTLERFVISSLPASKRLSGGKYTEVMHFDGKADAVDYCKATYPDLWAKTSIYMPGVFLSNMIEESGQRLLKRDDGTVELITFTDLDQKFPWILHTEDSGPFVKALVEEAPGKNLLAFREELSPNEIMKIFSDITGYRGVAKRAAWGEYWFPFPPDLSSEFTDMFKWVDEYGYEGTNDPTVIRPKDLDSKLELGTVEDFFKKHDWAKFFASGL